MVSGAARVGLYGYTIKLRVPHDKVFRKAIRTEKTSILSRSGIVPVQKIRKLADVSIGN